MGNPQQMQAKIEKMMRQLSDSALLRQSCRQSPYLYPALRNQQGISYGKPSQRHGISHFIPLTTETSMAQAAKKLPAQHQSHQPGRTDKMHPAPQDKMENYQPAGKLKGKVALITGGDSGIGRAVAIGYAKEGADVAIVYLEESDDAATTQHFIEQEGRQCLRIKGDVGDRAFCKRAIEQTISKFGQLDILVNNAGEQHVQKDFTDISQEQLERTFRTNIFACFYLTQAALEHMGEGARIINTASVTAYKGKKELIDYASTKGAIVALTRSLSQSLAEKKIYVNAVAPGPIWTPLIPSSFSAEDVAEFGTNAPLGRAGQPDEVAPSFIFLASDDASYMTGQVLHPNGGTIVNG
jgi:NAD(P)-dependent dehydrogenase (short-subunit alcohol dehydrogenase family)